MNINTHCFKLTFSLRKIELTRIAKGIASWAPIIIGANCWIATEAYINMGVTICDEAIIGARSSVFKSIDNPGVYIGTPAKKVKS